MLALDQRKKLFPSLYQLFSWTLNWICTYDLKKRLTNSIRRSIVENLNCVYLVSIFEKPIIISPFFFFFFNLCFIKVWNLQILWQSIALKLDWLDNSAPSENPLLSSSSSLSHNTPLGPSVLLKSFFPWSPYLSWLSCPKFNQFKFSRIIITDALAVSCEWRSLSCFYLLLGGEEKMCFF